jgi:flavin reductase (DIM6/NTAB) family NADH-FMN oxidoreductase RutF
MKVIKPGSTALFIKPGSTALFPVPAVMVSCGAQKSNIITLAWVGTVCSEPPSVGIGVRPDRFSHGLLEETGEFVVNLPRADQVDVLDFCGSVSGRDVDKWVACGLTPQPGTKVQTPLIAECPIALECKVSHKIELGAHDLFIGEILAVQADENVLNAEGAVDYQSVPLLTYLGGYYHGVGAQLGRHGDWRKSFK